MFELNYVVFVEYLSCLAMHYAAWAETKLSRNVQLLKLIFLPIFIIFMIFLGGFRWVIEPMTTGTLINMLQLNRNSICLIDLL